MNIENKYATFHVKHQKVQLNRFKESTLNKVTPSNQTFSLKMDLTIGLNLLTKNPIRLLLSELVLKTTILFQF